MASTGDAGQREFLARVGIGVLVSLAAAMTAYSVFVAATETPWDFQWSGARMLTEGRSPFTVFIEQGPGEFAGTQYPNYAPLLYLLLAPSGLLTLKVAAVAWAICNVGFTVVSGWLVGRGAGFATRGTVALTAALMISVSYYDAIHKGQQTLLVLLAAIVAARSASQTRAGALLAVTLAKYSFAPLALIWLARRQWKALLVTAWVHAGAVAAFCLVTGSSPVGAIAGPLRVAQTMLPGSGNVMTLADHAGAAPAVQYALALALAAVACHFARDVLRASDWVASLAVVSLIALATFPHLLYDYAFLLPVAAVGVRLRGWRRVAVLAPLVPTWFNWALGGISAYETGWAVVIFALTLLALGGLSLSGGRRGDAGDAAQELVADDVLRRGPVTR